MFIKMKTICITQIKSIFGAFERLDSITDLVYTPEVSYKELNNLLESNDFECIFTNPNKQNFMLNKQLLENTSVKVICTASTGTNHIDIKYCEDNGIEIISITKDHDVIDRISSTAEHTLALMLSLIRHIPNGFHSVKDGNWDWEPYVGRQMNSLTIGIIGYGRLGKMMAKYCNALDMKVLVYDPYVDVGSIGGHFYEQVELDELFKESNVISLHVHVTGETVGMINGKTISKMKKNPYLINTSRGEIVYEKMIIKALKEGKLSGYATDVIADEFDDISKSKLVEESINPNMNIIITPHIAGMTKEAQEIAYHWAIDKLENKYYD
jgi:D-3-phosphoglycerate dehydrogenase